jgi:hypothetical protein
MGFNSDMAKELNRIRDDLDAQRKKLYGHHEHCVCDSEYLCAYHADANNEISDAIKCIGRAVKVLHARTMN